MANTSLPESTKNLVTKALKTSNTQWVMKADLGRTVALYVHGGVYLDACNVVIQRDLSPLLKSGMILTQGNQC
eukprot:3890621-Karenia_brevis.AAC.1